MAGILIMAALAAFGLEVHPGGAIRRTASEASACGLAAGLRARIGELLAVGTLFGLLLVAALLLPAGAGTHPAVRGGTLFLSGVVLLCAGWHRISTTSRLDLRRGRLLDSVEETRVHTPVLSGFLGAVRQPAWHAFWWAVAPGLILVTLGESVLAAPLLWIVYAAVALAWSTFLASRLLRAGEKVVGTAEFRGLHSLGGLALIATAGLFFVASLAQTSVMPFTIEHVLRPLLGAS